MQSFRFFLNISMNAPHFCVRVRAYWKMAQKYKLAPKTPKKATSGTKIGLQQVIFGHF